MKVYLAGDQCFFSEYQASLMSDVVKEYYIWTSYSEYRSSPICKACNKKFNAKQDQIYCTKTCRNNAQKIRSAKKKRPECPFPTKSYFDSEEKANQALVRNLTRVDTENMKSYLCKCNYWHIGHQPTTTK